MCVVTGILIAGVGLYHSSSGLLTNNTVVRADNGFLRGSFFCLSGRREAGIGRWIAPNGDDYTLPGTHAFEVSVGGQSNPGVVEISIAGSDNRFPAGQWDGIYSCVIPDETGSEQRIYLGIYLVFGESLFHASRETAMILDHTHLYLRFSAVSCYSAHNSFFTGHLSLLHTELLFKWFSSHRSFMDTRWSACQR